MTTFDLPTLLNFLLFQLMLPAVAAADTDAPASTPLRALSTDRPDTTESAYSVDEGHFQVEWELANATRDGGQWSEFSLFHANVKYGISEHSDIQLVVPFFTKIRERAEGFGELEIRLKHNLWGNDGGSTAMAVMPYVKFPSASSDLGNGEWEGGLILPFAFQGPAGWGCSIMAQFDVVANERGSYEEEFLFSATASRDFTEKAALFLEGVLTTTDEAYFNTGMTYAMAENLQLDGGVRVGLTNNSPDFTPFLGLSVKF